MIIFLKLIFIVVVLFIISPFLLMALAFIGGGSVAPSTPERTTALIVIGIVLVLILVYIGFPVMVFLL